MVPRVGLWKDVKVDELRQNGDMAVARRVDRIIEKKEVRRMSDGTYVVRMDSALHDETFVRIPNMSMTMLRRLFPIDSAKYDLKMRPKVDDWKGGMVNPWTNRGKAIRLRNACLMVYKISSLQNQPAEYQRKFENKNLAEQVQQNYKGLKEDISQKKFKRSIYYEGVGHIYLKHSPTRLNYWHFELILENAEGEAINSVKITGDQKNMRPTFVEYVWNHFLNKQFWIDENPCDDIPESSFFDLEVCGIKRWAAEIMNKIMFASVPIVRVG